MEPILRPEKKRALFPEERTPPLYCHPVTQTLEYQY
jgi:hypothetical protein